MFIHIAAFGFVLTGIVNTFLGPLLPTLTARWRLSDSQAGYFFALQFLGSILGVGLSSALLPSRGFRAAIGISYFLMAVGVCGITTRQWEWALVGSFVLGLGFGIAIPATNLLVSSVHHRRPAGPLSLMNFCWGLGAVSVPVTIFLISGQKYLFLFLPVLSAVLVLSTLSLLFVSDERFMPQGNGASNPQGFSSFSRLVPLGAMFFLYVAVESSVGGWISTLARRDSANVLGEWTLAPCLFWAGLLLGRGIVPLMLTQIRERHLAIAGLLISSIGIVALVVLAKWQFIATAGFVVGLGLSPVFPITVALLAPFHATRNAGVMFALAGFGGAVMPEMVGMVSTRIGSLQAALVVPLVATGFLVWLHAKNCPPPWEEKKR
jgi:fucose permease